MTDANGIATEYTYSPAGLVTRIVRRDGADKYTYDYHVDGQLATATYGNTTEDFLWDGLALVKRGKRGFVNEPHVGGGNPVMSSDGTTYFNDMLGTTLSSSVNGETTASSLTAFGAETHNSQLTTHNSASDSFFTGKPFVPGLGHAFLFRNYRSDLGKWQTADPLGYPDGWNQLAYCGNGVTIGVDLWGAAKLTICSTASGAAGSSNVSGHSWIVYEDDNGNKKTYGTWGNNPSGMGNGLHEDLEKDRSSDVSRTFTITPDQEKALADIIDEYRRRGEDAWSPTDPCTDFATDVWERVTGEDLSSLWPWDTPSDLRDMILAKNENVPHRVVE